MCNVIFHMHLLGSCSLLRSDEELKPSCSALEEDEGFSDWSHRLEHRNEHELQEACRAKEHVPAAPSAAEEKKQQKDEEEHEGSSFDEGSTHHPEKVSFG